MHDVVRDFFPIFSEKFEGSVPWMYLDIKGLVTTAIGNLIDPMGAALSLPWIVRTAPQRPASRDEIIAEWNMVKGHPTAARQGHRVLESVTNLRLTPAGIAQVVTDKMNQNYRYLKGRFPQFDEWPAEAQLATLSMAWACGPAFRFKNLEKALRDEDFAMAADTCHIDDTHNPGVTPRNAANVALYETAAHVVFEELPRNVLRLQNQVHLSAPEPEAPDMPIIHPEIFQETYDRMKDSDNE